jgi:putative endonuclease
MRSYYVYILASGTRVLYVGVTNDLVRRLTEHRDKGGEGFTNRYRVTKLVHLETTTDVHAALAREKQLKSWRRQKKLALIQSSNPFWNDLSAEWTAG